MVIFKNQKPFHYTVSQSFPTAQKKVAAYPWEKMSEYRAASARWRLPHPVYKSGTTYDLDKDRHLFF